MGSAGMTTRSRKGAGGRCGPHGTPARRGPRDGSANVYPLQRNVTHTVKLVIGMEGGGAGRRLHRLARHGRAAAPRPRRPRARQLLHRQARDACVKDEVHGVRCTAPVGGRRIDGAGVQRACGSTIAELERRESTEPPGGSPGVTASQTAPGPRLKTPKARFRRPSSFGGWTFSLPGVTACAAVDRDALAGLPRAHAGALGAITKKDRAQAESSDESSTSRPRRSPGPGADSRWSTPWPHSAEPAAPSPRHAPRAGAA